MSEAKVNNGKLFVISGPSGSGKGTLTRALLERCADVEVSISATTRKPGENEVNGKDYIFVDKDKFEDMIEAGELLEFAVVFDNYYGTPAGPVKEKLQQGKTVILEIDVQGALQVFENLREAQGIFILPPSEQELERRLIARGRENIEIIRKRLEKFKWEVDTARCSKKYKNEIVNDDLEKATNQLVQIVSGK